MELDRKMSHLRSAAIHSKPIYHSNLNSRWTIMTHIVLFNPFLKRITNDVLNVELGLDARAMDFEANINQTTTGVSAQKTWWTVLPLGYGSIQIYPAKVIGFEAEFKGVFYGANNYMDIIGKIKILPYGPIEISVGYRYESLKADFGGDFKGNITINGPFVEAGVKF